MKTRFLIFPAMLAAAVVCVSLTARKGEMGAGAGARKDDPEGEQKGGSEMSAVCDSELPKNLTPEQIEVTQQKGTERPFSGKYWATKEPGDYNCVVCRKPLFSSKTKFDSHTGWPSFWAPVEGAKVAQKTDRSHGMARQEVVCGNCGAHLGHVFDDGPQPTGLRYCINSASLQFEPEKKADATNSP